MSGQPSISTREKMKPNQTTEPDSSGACAGSPLRWTRIEGQWHAEPKPGVRYMAVPALGDWYACVMVGTKYKRGETLSPNQGETEEAAKARCQNHWENSQPLPPTVGSGEGSTNQAP